MAEVIVPPVDPAAPIVVDPAAPTPEEMVSKQSYEQVKADLHKLKDDNKKLADAAETAKINAMKEKQDWEGIAKTREEEAALYKGKYEGLSTALVQNAKTTALREEARKQGILEQSLDDLEMLDFSEVRTETTSQGKIFVSGAAKAIESLKLKKPHWFGKTIPSINPHTPETMTPTISGNVTREQLSQFEAAYKKNQLDQKAKKAYFDALMLFKAQNPT